MGTRRLLVQIVTEYSDRGVKQATSEVEGLGSSIKGTLGAIATGAAVAAGAAIVRFSQESVQAFSTFEQGMREVFTLLPGITEDAMAQMNQDVLDFSKETGTTIDESIKSLYQAISAGIPAENAFSFLRDASASAKAGASSLEESVNVLSGAMNTYGAETVSAQKASDVLFTAVRLGKTTFSELSSSLANVLPQAQSLGIGIEDVVSSVTVLTTKNVSTAQATTQLRQAFIEASKSGTGLSDAIKELTGSSFAELIQQGNSSSAIFQMLRESMPEQEFRDLFSSVEAANAVLLLTGENSDQATQTLLAMGEAAGATAVATDVMVQSLENLQNRSNTSTEALKVQAGQALEPLQREYYKTVIAVSDYLSEDLKLRQQLITSSAALEKYGYSGVSLQKALGALGEGTVAWRGTLVDAETMARRTEIAVQLLEDGFQGGADELANLVIQMEKQAGMAKYAASNISNYETQNRAAAAAAREAAQAAQEQADALTIDDDKLRAVNRALLEFGGSLGPTTRELEEAAYASGDLGDYQEAMLEPIIRNQEALDLLAQQATATGDAFTSFTTAVGPLGIFNEELMNIVDTTGGLTVNTDSLNAALYTAADNAGANAGALALLKIATGELTEAQAQAIIKQIALDETLKTLAEGYAAGDLTLQQYMTSAQQAVEDINNMTVQFDTMTGSVETSSETVNSLVGVLGEIPSDIPVHISVTTDPVPALPNQPGGQQQPQYRAIGGPVNEGQPYIIGERGPELFVPNTSGTIVPNGGFGGFNDNSQTNIYANTKESAALALATVQINRRARINKGMGV